jgi:hypothetical protein
MGVFADSFYFIALLDEADSHHARVQRFSRERRTAVITTRWVLAEVADALCEPSLRRKVAGFLEFVGSSPSVRIVEGSDALFESGLALYRDRPDKHWSLTDCISFAVMKRQGLHEALTGDHHFEQAGFVALLA